MVTQVRLVNFKNHADTTLELGRMTALLGPNGVGKTSVLDALGLGRLYESYWSSRPPNRIRAGTEKGSVQIRIVLPGESPISVVGSFTLKGVVNRAIYQKGQHIKTVGANEKILALIAPAAPKFVSLVPTALKKDSYSDSTSPALASDGTGLATVIGYIKNDDDTRYKILADTVREVIPLIRQIRINPVQIHLPQEDRVVLGQTLLFDTSSGSRIPASEISDGSILTLGIITAICVQENPGLLLIDDIEQGLHPEAQRELIQQLRKLLDVFPELQVVMTTHSPYVVDELGPEEIYVMAADEDGIAHARKLSEHPDTESWMKILTTGEFWSAEGESWVLNAEPA